MLNGTEDQWYLPSPIQTVDHPLLKSSNVNLVVKRDDLIHPLISGNKWRKLKYLLSDHATLHNKPILTFGGAYSNHLYSFAAACKMYGLKGVVFVRGEEHLPLNPTLHFVRSCNVDIYYLNRSEYRLKEDSKTFKEKIRFYANPYIIPEGGSTEYAYDGLDDLKRELLPVLKDIHTIVIAAGTGCTSGCLINVMQGFNKRIEVYSALKGDFILEDIEFWAKSTLGYKVITDAHLGGYAKVNDSYIAFINEFKDITNIPLDPVYNGKLVYNLFQRIKAGNYDLGTTILWIHTGGLQGIQGFNERWEGRYQIR